MSSTGTGNIKKNCIWYLRAEGEHLGRTNEKGESECPVGRSHLGHWFLFEDQKKVTSMPHWAAMSPRDLALRTMRLS